MAMQTRRASLLVVVVACCVAALFTSVGLSFVGQPLHGPSVSVSAGRQAYTKVPLVMDPPEEVLSLKQRHLVPSAEHLEYAIVQFGTGQHMVMEGGMYETRFIRAVPGAKVRLNRVLLMKTKNDEDSFDVSIGQPFIDGAYADITILEHLLSEEQTMYLHKPKKHYQRRKIIQEKLTRFRIDKIVKEADDLPLAGRAPYPLAHQDEKFEEFWDEPDHGKRSNKIRRFEGLDYSDYEKMDDPTERGVEPKEKMGNRKFEVEPAVWDYEPEGKRRLF